MIREGQVVLFKFHQTDRSGGKLRPAVILRRLPGPYNDWLICMVSSQLQQQVPEFDEAISENDFDYKTSGLKMPSIIRIGRLAIVEQTILLGAIGEINPDRLKRIRNKLVSWIGNPVETKKGQDPLRSSQPMA